MDGDGWDDIAVGAPLNGRTGAVFLLRGPLGGNRPLAQADAQWIGVDLVDQVGTALTGLGDVDGDGLPDLLVGAPWAGGWEEDVGIAYLLLDVGAASGTRMLDDADGILMGPHHAARAGCALAGAGDQDGDGLADLLIGAEAAYAGSDRTGAAYLVVGFQGGLRPLADTARAVLIGEYSDGDAGRAVAQVGDLDGDGRPELAVGAPATEDRFEDQGLTAVFSGPLEGVVPLSSATARLWGNNGDQLLGSALSAAGDADGDGWPDLLVGLPGYTLSSTRTGAAWLLFGGPGL